MKKSFIVFVVGVLLALPVSSFALNINEETKQKANENINKAKNQAENSLFTYTTCEAQAKVFLKITSGMSAVINEAKKEVNAQSSKLNAEQKTQVNAALSTLEKTMSSCQSEIQKAYDPESKQCSEDALKAAYKACVANVKSNVQIFLATINDIAVKALGNYLKTSDEFLKDQKAYAETCANDTAKDAQMKNISTAEATHGQLQSLYDTALSKEDYVPTKEVTSQVSKLVSSLSRQVGKVKEDQDELNSCTAANMNTDGNTNTAPEQPTE